MTYNDSNIDFFLGNEISRIKKANSYELYILKAHIENALEARKNLEEIKNNLNQSNTYEYFDKDKQKKDVIDIFGMEETYVTGYRASDYHHVFVPYDAINITTAFDISKETKPEDEKSEAIEDYQEIKYRQKIAIERSVLLGGTKYSPCRIICYATKVNRASMHVRLLSGESIHIKKINSELLIYKPTESELKCFEEVESNDKFQTREHELASYSAYKYFNKYLDDLSKINKKRMHKHLSLLGYEERLINKLVDEHLNGIILDPEQVAINAERIDRGVDECLDHLLNSMMNHKKKTNC